MTIQTFQLHTNRIFINFIKKVFDFTIYMCYEMKALSISYKQEFITDNIINRTITENLL